MQKNPSWQPLQKLILAFRYPPMLLRMFQKSPVILKIIPKADPVFVNVKKPRNRLQKSIPPDWESIPGLLKRFTNSGSDMNIQAAFFPAPTVKYLEQGSVRI